MSDGNGALPEGWAEATLGDLGEWKGGGTPSKSNSAFWTNGKVPWVSPKDMKRFYLDDAEDRITQDAVKNSSAQLFPADSVLVVTRSGILQRVLPVAINRVPVATNQDLKTLLPTEGIDPRYVAYLLKGKDQHLRDECSKDGTTVASIDLPKLKAYGFGLAPEAEQRRIVSKIESLQERSSRARRALSEVGPLLEQFRQSVLRAAFSGRLTADWRTAHPHVEPATELLSRIRTERRHRWEQSELAKYKAKGKQPPKNWQDKYKELPRIDEELAAALPELPGSWCWACLEELKSFAPSAMTNGPFGSKLKTAHYTDDGVRVVRLGNIGVSEFKTKDESYISEERFEELRKHEILAGDVVIAALAEPVGRACLIPASIGRAIVKADCIRFRPHEDVLPEAIMHWLNSATGQRIAVDASHGIGRLRINMENLRSLPVALPPLEEQHELTDVIAEQLEGMKAIDAVSAESQSALTQLDQSILAKAFRGELVAQDPRDEPASELLARIRRAREATASGKPRGRSKRAAKRSSQPAVKPSSDEP